MLPDRGKQEVPAVRAPCARYAGRLCQCFGEDYTGNDRIAGKVTAKHGIARRKHLKAGGLPFRRIDHFVDKNERFAVRQAEGLRVFHRLDQSRNTMAFAPCTSTRSST